jgi:hypothetical protein
VLAVLGWLGSSFAVAYRLTRRARPPAAEPAPAAGWGTAEELALHTADGHTLGAWFFAGRADRPAVVLLHGNGGNRTACLPEAELLASAGYPVLAVTLRAHGDSSGDVNDFGLSARHDVVAAVGWLEGKRPGAPVVVWGPLARVGRGAVRRPRPRPAGVRVHPRMPVPGLAHRGAEPVEQPACRRASTRSR